MQTHELESNGITETTWADIDELKRSMSGETTRQMLAAKLSVEEWAERWLSLGMCWSSKYEGKLLAIGGFMHVTPDILQACQLPTIYLAKRPLQALRRARIIHGYLFNNGARRIATAGVHNPRLDKWHIALGYEREGFHRGGCANGADAVSWGNLGGLYGH